jgi:hypothetical protein
MKWFNLLGLLVLSFNVSIAQTPMLSPFKAAGDIMGKQQENYIAPLNFLKRNKVDTADIYKLSEWLQAMMTYSSFVEDYNNLLFYSDRRFSNELNSEKVVYDRPFVKQHDFINAANYIINQSKRFQVTMINEAHHLPYHRAFVLTMLQRFYDNGYRYLAIETLDDSLINKKKYPTYNTGYYTREPLFGELIRQALKIGFTLVPYDSNEDCVPKTKDPYECDRFRDSLMALNLSRILKNDAKGKILTYAGYDHIHEGHNNSWKKMAEFFKEFTGIDPLTVDLTKQTERFYPQFEEKEFLSVNKYKRIQQPVVALKNNKPWHGNFVDVTVIFPVYKNARQRASFYSINGTRAFYNLREFHLRVGQFVQAFYNNEKKGNRIPADQLVIGDGNNGLYLFKGKYVLNIKNQEGLLIKEYTVIVN